MHSTAHYRVHFLRAMMMGQNPSGNRLLLYGCKKDIYEFGLFPSFKSLPKQHYLWYALLKRLQLVLLEDGSSPEPLLATEPLAGGFSLVY